jgi:hypothetical protein
MRMIVAATMISTAVFAADAPRKIDFTTVLLDQDDKPMVECLRVDSVDRSKCVEEKTITLGWATFQALNMVDQGDHLNYTDAVKRGQLGLTVLGKSSVELTSEEITLIKTQLAKHYSPLVTTRAVALLDPAAK